VGLAVSLHVRYGTPQQSIELELCRGDVFVLACLGLESWTEVVSQLERHLL
jgi:hypothetical protein